MKKIIFILISLYMILMTSPVQAVELEYIRKNFEKSVRDEKLCKSLIEELSKIKGSPVHTAYLGAFQTIWAQHTINPLSKLNTFNKGKSNIERAMRQDNNNIEIYFIRLSVQKNCPGFLGYSNHIESDRRYIKKHLNEVNSAALKTLINKII